MKKRNKILLIVLILIIAVITVAGVIVWKNWNTVSTIYYIASGRESELESKRNETEKRADEAIKDLGIENFRPLTDEESDKLNSGEITEDEALDIILGNNDDETDAVKNEQTENSSGTSASTSSETSGEQAGSTSKSDSKPGKKPASGSDVTSDKKQQEAAKNNQNSGKTEQNKNQGTTKKPDENGNVSNENSDDTSKSDEQSEEIKAKNDEIAQLIGEMYVLKAKFSSDLAGIEDWVKDEYWIYTVEYGEGNVPSSIKTKIGKSAYAKASALETECDNRVNSILARITTLLQETNQSTAVVDEIRAAYENEKMLAKSYYMGQI